MNELKKLISVVKSVWQNENSNKLAIVLRLALFVPAGIMGFMLVLTYSIFALLMTIFFVSLARILPGTIKGEIKYKGYSFADHVDDSYKALKPGG